MDTAESVSKGCFAYKGKKKVTKPSDYFPVKDNTGKQRYEVYQEMWECVDTEIQILQSNLNSKIFEELLSFVKASHNNVVTSRQTVVKEIPTAALITGVNTPDHAVMFSNMTSLMKERVTPHITTLRSKDCPALKNILAKTISQLTSNPDLGLDDEEDDLVQSVIKRNSPCTMSTLVNWYQEKYSSQGSSPKKRSKSSSENVNNKPPLIVVLEDLESFSSHVLQDFISICSNYIEDLPLVLVFGIATSVSSVHRLLSNSVSSLLCMEKFQAPPSSDYLTQVINKVLFTSTYPFKLGPKVFHLLLDLFLYHDVSVLNFVTGLQFCMLDHYYSNPLGHLCCQETDIINTVKKLQESDLDRLRKLPSFSKYIECSVSDVKYQLLEDSKFTKGRVIELIQDLHDYHKSFFPVLNLLHVFVNKLPRHPLGKQLRELYSICIECLLSESEAFTDAFDLLRLLSKEELTGLLSEGIKRISESTLPHEIDTVPTQLETFLHRFHSLDAETEHMPEPEEDPVEDSEKELAIPKKTDLHNLRKTLQKLEKQKKRLTPYEKLRSETLDYLQELFKKYLKCPTSIPLYELLYYNYVGVIKHHINASPRSAIQQALSSPHNYLQCKCCIGDVSSILPTMPDVCIVYKLHLECGQLINLYDWLQAFITVITSEEEENAPKSKKPDQILQARFIRAVSELQFLGFIKPTKRKTDHVARLTWGGC